MTQSVAIQGVSPREHDRFLPASQNTGGHDTAWACLCALISVACVMAAWPVSNLPFNDDFSYCFTARTLAQTGHLQFNGWATAALGPQAYWGALFIKLFGFSFEILRLSTLPIAAASAWAAYALARRCGLRPGLAVLSSLTLSLSPLCLPLDASYMTDIPGLLFVLVSLYCLIRAGQAASAGRAIGWAVALIVLALLGGTVRQIVWVTALAGLPMLGWRRRGEVATVMVALIGWCAVVIGAWLTLHWIAAQPYATPEAGVAFVMRNATRHPSSLFMNALALLFTLILLTTPVTIPVIAEVFRRLRWRQWAFVAGAMLLVLIARAVFKIAPTAPWIGNTITKFGVMDFGGWGHGRPVIVPEKVWVVLSLLTYGILIVGFAVGGRAMAFVTSHDARRWLPRDLTPQSWIIVTLLLFAVGYAVLLLPRCAYNQAYDRYLLPMFPAVTIPLLLWYQAQGRSRRGLLIAWSWLIALALFGIALTEEVHGLNRARVAAADELRSAGVPRTAIEAGFEYDFWTQLEQLGYINEPRIHNPPEAYLKGKPLTSELHPRYRIEFSAAPMLGDERPSAFPRVMYYSYLPPFRRYLEIRSLTRDPTQPHDPSAPPTLARPQGKWF